MFVLRICVTCALLCIGVPSYAVPVLADDIKAMDKIDRDVISPEQKVPLLREQYARVSGRVDHIGLHNLEAADARDFYDASFKVAFYSSDRRDVLQMRKAFDELDNRGLVSSRIREEMLGTYVASRMFDDAQAFDKLPANAGLRKAPVFRNESKNSVAPTLLRITNDGLLATRHGHSIADRPQVIVVSSPGCHFSREAASAISKNKAMSGLMARASTWIVPQETVQNFEAIAKWNQEYPSSPMEAVYVQQEWAFISSWQTPGFYFIKGGKVVASVLGWPDGRQMGKVQEGFAKIGM